MDFTLNTYKLLLYALRQKYFFQPFSGYLQNPLPKSIILRHDVDQVPANALKIARIEARLGITASYYFRIVPESFQPIIIRAIADLGHEIGYHYEDLSLVNGNIDKAYEAFCRNLEKFRQYSTIKTICMHGSPKSRWDSKMIWKKYNYRGLGILGEPYFDIDYNKVFYLTDTGRRWDGWSVNIRDKVPEQKKWFEQGLVFHSTQDIIKALQKNQLPDKIMITTHPQRWTDKPLPWIKELVWQNVKNEVKRALITGKTISAKQSGSAI